MRRACLLLALLIAACAEPAPSTHVAATTSPGSCRLPIAFHDNAGSERVGFVTFPGGEVTVDSSFVGSAAVYYDRPFKRWLPVAQKAVASDGATYAYLELKVPGTEGQQVLHVVDVASGRDKRYALGSSTSLEAYAVVQLGADGVWLSYAGYESPRGGLFLFDPASGILGDVGGRKVVFDPVAGRNGVFWFTDAGPHPRSSAGLGGVEPARVQRFTVSDGQTVPWFTSDSGYVTVVGTDLAGAPIITDASNVWVAPSPSEAHLISLPAGYYQVLTDGRYGIWFGGDQGVYLYSVSGDVEKVSTFSAVPAGACT